MREEEKKGKVDQRIKIDDWTAKGATSWEMYEMKKETRKAMKWTSKWFFEMKTENSDENRIKKELCVCVVMVVVVEVVGV